MMHVGRLAAILIPGACLASSVPRADFVSTRGVQLWRHGTPAAYATKAMADAIEARLVSRLTAENGTRYPVAKTLGCLRRAEVHMRPKAFDCGNNGLSIGCQSGGYLEVVAVARCLYDSPYGHELMHWLQECIHDLADYHHSEPIVWNIADSAVAPCAAPTP